MKINNFMTGTWGLVVIMATCLPLPRTYGQPAAPGTAAPVPAAATASAEVPAVSPGVAEVIRLAQSGVGEEVVSAYIQNSTTPFNLSADQILYLRDLGISSQLITAMLNRDAAFRNPQEAAPATQAAAEPAPPPAPTVPVEAPLTPSPQEVVTPPPTVSSFYSDLTPYGTWVDLEGVGWCWQPSVVVVNRGWRPYCDGGYWVYTDAGWYWQSQYSWGWAPFHYGRWHMHPRCGWVWTPDTVWAPAWVVWRSYGDYCGWAPLPPHAVFEAGFGWRFNGIHVGVDFDFGLHADHFTFIAVHDFCDRDLGHRHLAPIEVTRIYNRTTIINNYTVNNKTIVNRGISVDRVAAVASTPVRRASIREVSAAGGGRTMAMAQSYERGAGVVYRAQPRAPAKAMPVAVQKVDERHPVIQHTPQVPVVSRSSFERGTTAPGVRQTMPQTSRSAPRTVERPGGSPPATRSYEPAQRSTPPPARSSPPARTYSPSAQAAPSGPTATQPSRDYKQPERVAPTYRSEPSPRVEAPARGRASETPPGLGNNPHVYYPKTYHQSEETRQMPPSAPRGQPAPPPQSGQSGRSGRKDF